MAKQRVTAESHPWVVARRNANDSFFKTRGDAMRFCETQLAHLKVHLAPYDKNVAVIIADVVKELHDLPEEGGWIDAVVDGYTGARFDAHIYRRA